MHRYINGTLLLAIMRTFTTRHERLYDCARRAPEMAVTVKMFGIIVVTIIVTAVISPAERYGHFVV